MNKDALNIAYGRRSRLAYLIDPRQSTNPTAVKQIVMDACRIKRIRGSVTCWINPAAGLSFGHQTLEIK